MAKVVQPFTGHLLHPLAQQPGHPSLRGVGAEPGDRLTSTKPADEVFLPLVAVCLAASPADETPSELLVSNWAGIQPPGNAQVEVVVASVLHLEHD